MGIKPWLEAGLQNADYANHGSLLCQRSQAIDSSQLRLLHNLRCPMDTRDEVN